MLNFAKKPLPMIGKLSEMLVSGNRAGFLDVVVTSSPRSPLDLKMQSSFGGVGLGIAAALEKTSSNNGHLAKYAICSHSCIKSDHIPVSPGEKSDEGNREIEEEDSEENYTFVTCHGSNKSVTKVYYDGGDYRSVTSTTKCHVISHNENHRQKRGPVYPTSKFLSSCHLCSKRLDGLDIYMYRGDKAFCSTECRATQMTNDEQQERCRSEASRRSADVVSSSTYEKDQIFFCTAIFAI